MSLLQWGRDLLIAEIGLKYVDTDSIHWLQWGRDLLIAEMSFDRSIPLTKLELQWGRDLLIAEILDIPFTTRGFDRFNGAAIC